MEKVTIDNLKELKLFSAFYTVEHDNLSKDDKIQILNFIKEANESQVLTLLATGKMKQNLSEEDKKLVSESALQYALDPEAAVAAGMKLGMGQAAFLALIAVAAIKAYKRFFSKAAKACGGRSGIEKTSCMKKFKLDAQKAKIAVLQKGFSGCSKTRNPERCKKSMQKKINKEKAKIGTL